MQIETMEINAIYEGDNLEITSKFPDESVNVVYADPPFFSNRHYEVIWDDGAEIRAFQDRWKGGIENYIAWMEPRLRECHRLLKESGSMYLHCDWHADAHLRVLMDKIFGESNFRNEIIWKRSTGHPLSVKKLETVTDTILYYEKSEKVYFSPVTQPLKEKVIERDYKNKDEHGYYQNVDLTGGKGGGKEAYEPFNGTLPTKGRAWAPPRREKLPKWAAEKLPSNYEKMNQLEKCKALDKMGMIYWSKNKTPRFKRYLPDNPTTFATNLWDDINLISSQSEERLGYPTQKPVALLERIINASSKKGEIIFDPFCGCGTTLAASHKLDRKWVGIDVSPTACKLMKDRMRKFYSVDAKLIKGQVDMKYIKKLEPFEFQNWVVVDKFLGTISRTKSGDMGIDGLTPQVMGGYPIQVKQSEDIGRNVVDNFETAMRRMGKKTGYIVAFSFGKGAYEEVARVKNQGELTIILRTVQELLDGKIEALHL